MRLSAIGYVTALDKVTDTMKQKVNGPVWKRKHSMVLFIAMNSPEEPMA